MAKQWLRKQPRLVDKLPHPLLVAAFLTAVLVAVVQLLKRFH